MFSLIPYSKKNNSVASVFDDFERSFFNSSLFSNSFFREPFALEMQMKSDIRETDKDYVIESEIPGVKKEEISVKYENKTLIISVNRNEEVNEDSNGYIRKERRISSQSRSFMIPKIKEDEISAKLEDGVLRITLPKLEVAENNRLNKIEIQ